jgi:hypothetical protein
MLLIYLVHEKGTLFDPISISWIGYIVFIGVGPLATGILIPQRGTNEVEGYAMTLYVLAGIMYTVGLYVGRGGRLGRFLPVPAPFLGTAQVWMMWIFCATLFGLCWGGVTSMSPGMAKIFGAFYVTSIGTLALISIFVLISYKGHIGTKLLMLTTLVLVLLFYLKFYWSRRPVLGLFLTAVALFYYLKISWRRPVVRMSFMVATVIAGVSVLLYLGATRVARVSEFYRGPSAGVFSRTNWEDVLSGITINTMVYEYMVQQFPEQNKYLHGTGIVPAFIFFVPRAFWPGKPLPTGGVVSSMWFNVIEPPVSVGPTLPGELYANFGPLGIFFGMFLVGKIIRAFNSYLKSMPDNLVAHMVWFVVIPDFATEWRGDFTSMSVQGFIRVFMFFFLAWLAGKLTSSRQDETHFDMGPPGADYSEDESSIYNEQR